jgi:hypothetical protein
MPPQFLSQLEGIRDLPEWQDRMVALGQLLRPLLLPFTLGSSLGCIVLGLAAYRATLTFLIARKRHVEQAGRP